MHRFFVNPSHIQQDRVTLPPDTARQLARVLRARPGDDIIVLDDAGRELTVTLDAVTPKLASGVIINARPGNAEPNLAITLYQGMMKADRVEYVLQKGTELGISRFVPIICERTIARNIISAQRLQRWRKIIKEAAEQAGRCKLPILEDAPLTFTQACESISQPAIIGWECERNTTIKDALLRQKATIKRLQRLSIIIGSEGGLTKAEATRALNHNITPISLGKRILRAETAGIIAATAALYEMDELG